MANVVRGASSGSPERDAARRADGQVVDLGGTPDKVAVLCAQERLRTILRLSLQADDHDVVEWNHRSGPGDPSVAAIVLDLDSLGHDVPGTLDLLSGWGIDESTSLLFISVYPLDLRLVQWIGSYDVLQPPFSPVVLIERVRRLIRRSAPGPRPGARNGSLIMGDGAEAAPRGEPCVHP
jgi:DNA-binding response OmpR family regulator